MHNQGKCQKEPKRVTLLSQRDASAQECQQEQVLSSGSKNELQLECNTSHTVTYVCTVAACTYAHASPLYSSYSLDKMVLPKYPVIGM